ncbi:hypothetical protein PPL_03360 [Heterostelium album PN500]|uniref:Ankyrin repeat protein n=1 Tax=Heterostelium pallidum (strain ATCC 26659 / Pp 5 / PN500) TaxID=670386 RepID=D3B4N5_HETP5|nr:hypothetical protein PPL_03360 [Heterostelium album PN500]EFA84283.1 hypothetical protein PPL_03360 [Heterostelium album PN500]|eukprot:XP_020436399.1 hypothetical protein PPL_03360 [Heterostelium album PN500]
MAMHYLKELENSCNHDETYHHKHEYFESMEKAVSNGNMAAVRFIVKYNISEDNHNATNDAAHFGNLSIMKFLLSTGTQCSSETFDNAARNNQFQILKFLYENRTEGPVSSDLLDNYGFKINQEIIDYIKGNERIPYFKNTKKSNIKRKTNRSSGIDMNLSHRKKKYLYS